MKSLQNPFQGSTVIDHGGSPSDMVCLLEKKPGWSCDAVWFSGRAGSTNEAMDFMISALDLAESCIKDSYSIQSTPNNTGLGHSYCKKIHM